MPVHPEWSDVALRLLCAVVAGFVTGYDRGEHGRPAGLRTTMLVSFAACVAMIQANLLLAVAGKTPDSFVVLDLMRLPLGILSGMGFKEPEPLSAGITSCSASLRRLPFGSSLSSGFVSGAGRSRWG
jgi:uncharacterized membrane protein YhiD involved in acid resistance